MDRTATHLSPSRAKRYQPRPCDAGPGGIAARRLAGVAWHCALDTGARVRPRGQSDPFQDAGAWRLNNDGSFDVLREDFFQRVGDRKVNFIEDYMGPFFARVAENIRQINPDWMLFAELDPLSAFFGPRFPAETPPNSVNAGHWYDVVMAAT